MLSYLDDIDRVTSPRYTPNEGTPQTFHADAIMNMILDDVLKARLKTVGVCEYSFELEVAAGAESGTEWKIIDVGGSRSQRRKFPRPLASSDFDQIIETWAQFFDDGK